MLNTLVSPGVHNSMTSDFNGAVLGQGLPNGTALSVPIFPRPAYPSPCCHCSANPASWSEFNSAIAFFLSALISQARHQWTDVFQLVHLHQLIMQLFTINLRVDP